MLNIGDYVGQINKDSSGVWRLYKDKINKITITKKETIGSTSEENILQYIERQKNCQL